MSYQISPRLPQSSVPRRCTGNDAVYSPQPFPTPDPPSSDVAPTPPQIHRSGKACMRRVDRRCVTEPPGEVRPISRSLEGNARPTCHAAGQPGHGSLSPESTTEGWPVAELLHTIGKPLHASAYIKLLWGYGVFPTYKHMARNRPSSWVGQ